MSSAKGPESSRHGPIASTPTLFDSSTQRPWRLGSAWETALLTRGLRAAAGRRPPALTRPGPRPGLCKVSRL